MLHFKRNFLTGLVILLPVTVTFALALFLFNLLTEPFAIYVEQILNLFFQHLLKGELPHHETFIYIISRILVVVFLLLFIALLGFLGQWLVFKWVVDKMHNVFLRIPFVKTVFTWVRDITDSLFSEKSKLVGKTALVAFPDHQHKALCFVLGPCMIEGTGIETPLQTIFIPTSPHPISGYVLLCDPHDLINTSLTTEQTFKILISCGIMQK